MSSKFLRQATSGFVVLGTTLGMAVCDAIAPSIGTIPFNIGSQSALAQEYDEEISVRVYEQASPAVISIRTEDGTGSGSIISPDGLVLTNAHVVGRNRNLTVLLADGRQVNGRVVGYADDRLDLAAIQLEEVENLPYIPIASNNSVRVGQRAYAIGNPFGQFQGTFTTGIVSRIDSERGLIQTDAAINPGNSGGPLLNSRGELIGVNTSIFTIGRDAGNIGIGFAIATDQVQPFLTAVREGRAAQEPAASPFDLEQAKPIALNGPAVQGQLGRESSVLPADNSYFDLYAFEGQAGQQVVIEMTSSEVDAYLILLGPDGQDLAQDDDSGGRTNARLATTLPENGTYTVLANSYAPGELGSYSIRLASSQGSAPSAGTTQPPNSGSQPNGSATAPSSGDYILQEQGTLASGGPVLQDGSLYQEYRFEGESGQSVTITLESTDFDPYLMLIDPNGDILQYNDDMDDDTYNSQITTVLPASGTYRVIANSYDPAGQGDYEITVR